MGIFDFLFGNKKENIQEFLDKGAIILDVRTKGEWDNGHIKNATHMPLDQLRNNVGKIQKMNKPIITCCASGARSGQATQILKSNNIEAINGGGWSSLQRKILS